MAKINWFHSQGGEQVSIEQDKLVPLSRKAASIVKESFMMTKTEFRMG